MKCPRCGHWNKASFPHCFKCGEPLTEKSEKAPEWQEKFDAPPPKKTRVVFDDTVQPVEDITATKAPEPDPLIRRRRHKQAEPVAADVLADEMASLKERRARGSAYLQELRQNAADQGIAPSVSGVSVRRSGGIYTDVPDNPDETVQVAPDANELDDLPEAYEDIPRPRTLLEDSPLRASGYMQDDDPYAMYDSDLPPAYNAQPILAPYTKKGKRSRRVRGPMLIAYGFVGLLVLAIIAFGVYAVMSFVVPEVVTQRGTLAKLEDVEITPIDMDGLAGHRVRIAGEEGTVIYIGELGKSYVVVGGVATIELADHVFYDMIEPLDKNMETMEVVLSPTVSRHGTETRMEAIKYMIDIPLSPITLVAPSVPENDRRLEVSASMYSIKLEVEPNSKVIINGNDISDTVKENGELTYNVPVRAIGNNIVAITVRAPFCREDTMNVTLYRAPMDITLELNADTAMDTSYETLTIYGTTEIGATIALDSPGEVVSLDPQTGKFSVSAKMGKVGTNKVIIRASYEGRADATLVHEVYYLPPADTYTRKAWALNASDYSELMNNIALRIEKTQIYLCEGTIVQEISKNPQLVIMNTGTEAKQQLVLLQNATIGKVWEEGKKYSVYADVDGVYNNMPRMMGRYSYVVAPAATTSPDATSTSDSN